MPKITKQCIMCGASFECWPSQGVRRITCSKACGATWREQQTGAANPNWKGGDLSATCRQCGKLFTFPRDRREAVYCSRKCHDAADMQRAYGVPERPDSVMRECRHCGGLFAVPVQTNARYCSNACLKLSLRQARNASRLVACERCGKQFWAQKKSQPNAKFCSRACRNGARQVRVMCEWCGAETSKYRSHTGYGHTFCSDEHRIYWLNAARREPTQPELAMCAILTELGIPFCFQQPHGPYILDFTLTGQQVNVEVDGEYWHALHPEHDIRRDRYMTHHGWRVLRFPSKSLDDREGVKQQLLAITARHP